MTKLTMENKKIHRNERKENRKIHRSFFNAKERAVQKQEDRITKMQNFLKDYWAKHPEEYEQYKDSKKNNPLHPRPAIRAFKPYKQLSKFEYSECPDCPKCREKVKAKKINLTIESVCSGLNNSIPTIALILIICSQVAPILLLCSKKVMLFLIYCLHEAEVDFKSLLIFLKKLLVKSVL